MQSVITQDPYQLGPDVAGMIPPDHVYAIVFDAENSGSVSQISQVFEASLCHADFLVMDTLSAYALFVRLQISLTLSRDDIEEEGSSALLALWKLSDTRCAFMAADVEGGFARCAVRRALAETPFQPISRLMFDATRLKHEVEIPEGTRDALKKLSNSPKKC